MGLKGKTTKKEWTPEGKSFVILLLGWSYRHSGNAASVCLGAGSTHVGGWQKRDRVLISKIFFRVQDPPKRRYREAKMETKKMRPRYGMNQSF